MRNTILRLSFVTCVALSTQANADDLAYGVARLQWTHLEGADFDTGGEMNYERLMLQSALSKPIHLFSGLHVVPTVRYTWTDAEFPNATLGSFEDLHQIELPMTFFRKYDGTPWTFTANLTPGIASDFEEVNGDDFFLDARIGGEYEFSERFSINFGLAYTRFTGEPEVIPFVGFDWKPSDAWRLSLFGPKLDIRYSLAEDWRVRLSGAPGGGLWNFGEDVAGKSRDLDISSYHVGLTIEKELRDNLWIYAGAGLALANETEVRDSSNNTLFKQDADDSIFWQCGLRLGEW